MSFPFKPVVLLLSIVTVFGADKEKKFEAGAIDSYDSRLTIQKLTIAADPFAGEEKTREAFGKLNPNQYGILPVLMVVKNDGGETISLETMRIEYIIQPSREGIDATPAADVRRIRGGEKPKIYPGPLPTPTPRIGGRKNPLAAEEIESRAFAAKMLPPGESASGFVYFQTSHRPGSVLYITGIREAASRRELFYFEIPLDR